MKKLLFGILIPVSLLVLAYALAPPERIFQLAIDTERTLAGFELKKVKISEGEITYLEGGTGPTLLLLHGFGANKDNWNRLAIHLSSKFHIVALDIPGFGDSYKDMALNYDVDSQVKRIEEFANALGLDEFYIGGNSMGGYIAGNYAATYADKVAGLWLLNPLGVESAPGSEMFKLVQQGEQPVVLAANREQYDKLVSFVFHKPPFMPDLFIDELAKKAKLNYPIRTKIFADIHYSNGSTITFTAPLDKTLESFSKPVLITWGDNDRILHAAGAKILAEKIPNATLDLMEDMGHLPMIEAPAETAEQFILFSKK